MANDKAFKIKNGLSATRYLQSSTALAASDVDMSSGSYFTKTLSANTTFTFSNPPASGTAGSFALEVTGADVASSFDIANASFDGTAKELSGINSFSTGFAFNADGTKLYVTGISTDAVQQYSLSTAFDVSTATYDSVSFSVSSQEASAQAVLFNDDGTSMYVSGSDNDTVYQYTLTTAFDVSTASYASKSLDLSTQEGNPNSLTWNDDGTKLYVGGNDALKVFQYNLTTAYDVSTGSYANKSLDISGQITGGVDGVAFNSDGTKLFVAARSTVGVYQYSLSTAYDVSTGSYDSVSFGISSSTDVYDMRFNNDGTKMYILNRATNRIMRYSTSASTPATITYPSSVKWSGATAPDAPAAGEKDVYVFVTTDGGTTYYGKQAGDAVA